MLNASVGVQRVLGRLRRPIAPDETLAIDPPSRPAAELRVSRQRIRPVKSHAISRPRHRRALALPVSLPTISSLRAMLAHPDLGPLSRLSHERIVAVAVAAIVLGASLVSVGPAGASGGSGGTGGTGGPNGDGPAPRLALAGAQFDDSIGDVEADYVDSDYDAAADGMSADGVIPLGANVRTMVGADDSEPAEVGGPFLADGTLLKPVAVDTSVADGRGLVTTYKVKAGDTLVGIARAHGVSMMTLWWANKLKNKDDLHRGQVLRIPPVTGLVVKVKSGDTLGSLAAEYKVTEDEILSTNEITDTNLVVGQVLVVPGAKGDPIPTPKPEKPKARSGGGGNGGGGSSRPPKTYRGGNFRWPTSSHHISQYFHYGHYGIDIDGSTGDPVWAAASGTVTFAGWKSNGGGYQVWIAHGSGLYTTYNHMSSVSVGRGQHVAKGQRVGRVGATGFATGSHLHFEVWRGPIWDGGSRINPLKYL